MSVASLAGAIFIADTVTNLEIAVAVLYVAVILISVRGGHPRAVMGVGVGCAVLTVLSFCLTRTGAFEPGLANCTLSLVAIGATTWLAIRIEAAGVAIRQAQADLAHMSRVMIMSELTTSIAHEVSQPLAAIVANSNAAIRWLSRSPANEDEARRALDRIAKDADRAGAVIARVRHLVKRVPASKDSVDLREMITDSLALVREQIRVNRILLRTELANNLPDVMGDRVQLQQVVLNMLLNGIEALSRIDPESRELLVNASTQGRHITVSVSDSGVGIPYEAADRVFDAFYTTKPDGMGVGLAISRSIVEAHGGTMSIAPHEPRGTTVGFALPQGKETKE